MKSDNIIEIFEVTMDPLNSTTWKSAKGDVGEPRDVDRVIKTALRGKILSEADFKEQATDLAIEIGAIKNSKAENPEVWVDFCKSYFKRNNHLVKVGDVTQEYYDTRVKMVA